MQSKSTVLLTLWLSQIKSLEYINGLKSQVLFILGRRPSLALLLALPSGSGWYPATVLLKQSPCQAFPWLILVLLLPWQAAVWAITWWTHSRNWPWWKHPTKKLKITAGTMKTKEPAARECQGTNETACPSVPSPREKPATRLPVRNSPAHNYGTYCCS